MVRMKIALSYLTGNFAARRNILLAHWLARLTILDAQNQSSALAMALGLALLATYKGPCT